MVWSDVAEVGRFSWLSEAQNQMTPTTFILRSRNVVKSGFNSILFVRNSNRLRTAGLTSRFLGSVQRR